MINRLMSTYKPLPLSFEKGSGCWLWDTEGNKYLDAMSGLGVSSLGHSHPKIIKAIEEQSKKVLHTSNVFTISEQQKLADELTTIAGMDKAFFANSGAEANEAAIKLARLYGHHKGIDNPSIIVMEKSFHGRTLATLSASGNRKIQAGFEPLVSGFIRAPFNDIQALKKIADVRKDIVAVMLEPILGNGGIIIPNDDYLFQIRKHCDEQKWLMIVDEIQTGIGRTGEFYAYQHSKIFPDIVTTSKALGNGIPISACIAKDFVSDLFKPGKHGTTFGGNPFCCHVARSVLKIIKEEKLIQHAKKIGNYLLEQLKESLKNKKNISSIRGKGLMIGIELDQPRKDLLLKGIENKILFSITAEKVVRLLPPLIIQKKDADMIVEKLCWCFE